MKRRMIGKYRWWVQFEKRDVWVGVFWKRHDKSSPHGVDPATTVYICIVPCLPLVVERY